ncbi:hypothetical protein D3C73_1148820 [compost metagenome]
MHEAEHVPFELDCAVPWLESEGGCPHVPEIRLEKMRPEPVIDPRFAHLLLRSDDHLAERQPVGHIKAHGQDVLHFTLAVDQPGIGMRRIGIVKGNDLFTHRLARVVNGRDRI